MAVEPLVDRRQIEAVAFTSGEGHEQSRSHQHPAADPRYAFATPTNSFGQDEDRQGTDPDEVHHADREQPRHERPAAAETVDAVPKSDVEGPRCAVAPVAH